MSPQLNLPTLPIGFVRYQIALFDVWLWTDYEIIIFLLQLLKCQILTKFLNFFFLLRKHAQIVNWNCLMHWNQQTLLSLHIYILAILALLLHIKLRQKEFVPLEVMRFIVQRWNHYLRWNFLHFWTTSFSLSPTLLLYVLPSQTHLGIYSLIGEQRKFRKVPISIHLINLPIASQTLN